MKAGKGVMGFTLRIKTDGAAFTNEDTGEPDPREVARLLRLVAEQVEDYRQAGTLRDYNGAAAGGWEFTEED